MPGSSNEPRFSVVLGGVVLFENGLRRQRAKDGRRLLRVGLKASRRQLSWSLARGVVRIHSSLGDAQGRSDSSARANAMISAFSSMTSKNDQPAQNSRLRALRSLPRSRNRERRKLLQQYLQHLLRLICATELSIDVNGHRVFAGAIAILGRTAR